MYRLMIYQIMIHTNSILGLYDNDVFKSILEGWKIVI